MRVLKEIRVLVGNYHVKSGLYHFYRAEYRPTIDFLRKALQSTDSTTAVVAL